MTQHDVLIVGAGPTGLVLALWLTKQGVSVRIVDRAAGPGTTSRAMAVQARTLELYRQLGMADEVAAAGRPNPAINLWVRGDRKARLSFGDAGEKVTPYPFLLIYPQDQHERLLISRLEQLGVTVERETELAGLEDRGDHVVGRLRSSGGFEESCTARYVAGCDGARSPVRHLIGSGFDGGTYDKTFYVADVEARGAAADGEGHIALDQADFVVVLGYGAAGQARLIGTVRDERPDGTATALRFEDVGHRALDRLGLEVTRVHWFSTYRVHHRVTDRYRRGNVFLLGDAAHVHSPAGGQGMNTGIGDAVNLAWKLEAVLRGRAPDALLDSYQTERRAFAERLVDTTDRAFTLATAQGTLADFVRTRLVPLVVPAASRIDAVRETAFRVLSQTMIHYRESPLSAGEAGEVRGGDRLPWVRTSSSDNYDSLAAIAWQAHAYGTVPEDVERWCADHGVPLHRFGWDEAHGRAGFARDALYLLRPDTYVGLALPRPGAMALDAYAAERGLKLGPLAR
ncbi:FAD-dependent oxidoreductase [Longimicrobium terrae]|uniref:2-polyprenyl-6-methoxyphenol hydroxylase-like FAD-dependent oxidoreductase n=1 Tax=Longimicrobium terrae TaxID=1639882 RepID=A0A841GP56_9BACT|nr:2-polyprenyl-6-methoxyphenol hydroxylase-like FAD-dependent oxidoreductase [Longimicrobium terrae]MBB6068690.1 2-polyprenyl-6-methoxyphenol hydroxylase-like FAD-dependent oxidoreductase [Longimicrobium terrae]NNC27876.1 FAD-dependent oxidoreductase [Longimicrobium terrae]